MRIFPTFANARQRYEEAFLSPAAMQVRGSRWQGVDISTKPEMATRELLNQSLQIPLRGLEGIDYWAMDTGANLPWADVHFDERVGGEPLNPGESWKSWPWGHSADKFRIQESGPYLPESDWAYLAGIIDGEGTIHYHQGRDHHRVIIAQKDHDFLTWIYQKFRVGTLNERTEQTQILNGKKYTQHPLRWAISAQNEVTWILKNCLPYLGLKREKAVEALEAIAAKPANGNQRKEIWDRRWEPRFDHTYMQRFWPKFDNGSRPKGILFEYGDLNDLVTHLADDPLSRQAYLPIWFPEDGTCKGRKPCTLGYHFINRYDYLHLTYYIRSCDFIRHWGDDCYLAVRLLLWILDRLRERDKLWKAVRPGMFTMHCVSLHLFENDYVQLQKKAAGGTP